MTETHTHLPWRAGDSEIFGADDSVVCTVHWRSGDNCHQANLETIVQAVNSHHRLVEALEPFAFVGEDDPKDTQAVWEMIYRDRVQDWFSYEDFERARDLLAALKEAGR